MIIARALILLLFLLSHSAFAASLADLALCTTEDERIDLLHEWVSAKLEHPAMLGRVEIRRLSQQEMRQRFCEDVSCDLRAFQRDGVIYVVEAFAPFANMIDTGILAHELAHYDQQRVTGKNAGSPEEHDRREAEALWLQSQFHVEIRSGVRMQLLSLGSKGRDSYARQQRGTAIEVESAENDEMRRKLDPQNFPDMYKGRSR